MLEYLHSITTTQWVAIAAAMVLLLWPYIAPLFGRCSLSRDRAAIDSVLKVRKALAGEDEALNALDTIVIPAVIRKETT